MPTKNEMSSSREECVVVFEMHVVSLSGAFHDELQVVIHQVRLCNLVLLYKWGYATWYCLVEQVVSLNEAMPWWITNRLSKWGDATCYCLVEKVVSLTEAMPKKTEMSSSRQECVAVFEMHMAIFPFPWFSCSHMVVKPLLYCTRKCGCKGGCVSASCFLQPPRNGSTGQVPVLEYETFSRTVLGTPQTCRGVAFSSFLQKIRGSSMNVGLFWKRALYLWVSFAKKTNKHEALFLMRCLVQGGEDP